MIPAGTDGADGIADGIDGAVGDTVGAGGRGRMAMSDHTRSAHSLAPRADAKTQPSELDSAPAMKIPHEAILRAASQLAPDGDVRKVPTHERLAFAAVVAKESQVPPAVVREVLVRTWLLETGAMEAAAIDHRVQRGDFPRAEFGGTNTGGWMARLQAVAKESPGAAPPDVALEGIEASGLLYGYKLGPAERDTRAWHVARLLQGTDNLSVEAAAFDKAVVAVHRRFQQTGVQLNFSLKRGTGLISDEPGAAVEFTPGRAVAVKEGEDTVKGLFETLYGNFTRVFTSAYLQRTLQREPGADELAREMKELFATSGVDVQVYLSQLARSSDAADQALHRALVER